MNLKKRKALICQISILLLGWVGTRLWPLSRKSYPKQFSELLGESTLFQSSAQRLTSSDIIEFAPHITLTNSDFRFIVEEQLQKVGIDPGPILIEPEAKNTAAAILAASIFTHSKEEDALLIAPSDHVIPDVSAFHEAISVGLSHVKNGKIITFGIKPTHAETGYGYLELSIDFFDPFRASEVKRFVEKPNATGASKMFASGNYLWNAGIFLFRAVDMIDAFNAHAPNTLELVSKSVITQAKIWNFFVLQRTLVQARKYQYRLCYYGKCRTYTVPYASKWSDLGGMQLVRKQPRCRRKCNLRKCVCGWVL